MKKAALAVVLLFVAGASTTRSGNFHGEIVYRGSFIDGNELFDKCDGDGGAGCDGYIAGVIDAFDANTGMGWMPALICLPKGATLEQVIDVVKKYLKEHPDERNFGGPSFVFNALVEAFPCEAEE